MDGWTFTLFDKLLVNNTKEETPLGQIIITKQFS
jgi:hypothetical protein